jgi:hypothetical protein
VVRSQLVELGRRTIGAVERSLAGGAPRLQCQLLASDFYESLQRELQETSEADSARRTTLIAAARHCDHIATQGISPDAMVRELRAAVASLQDDLPAAPRQLPAAPRQLELRPLLRVIDGGLDGV